jgi:hypothetical protein
MGGGGSEVYFSVPQWSVSQMASKKQNAETTTNHVGTAAIGCPAAQTYRAPGALSTAQTKAAKQKALRTGEALFFKANLLCHR